MVFSGHRQERLADQIRDEVAAMISGELKDPRIGIATVTRVDLTPDLQLARVQVSVLGGEQARQETLEGLSAAVGYVRYALGRRLRVRRAPEVIFILDREAEESQRIEASLQKLNQDQ